MKLLLDTNAFIWLDADPSRLSPRASMLLTDPANEVLLSAVSVWEIVIKSQIGKLALRDAIPRVVSEQVGKNSIHLLEVQVAHVYAVSSLPRSHKDPFDRLLVAQAIEEGASLVTSDSVFSQYPVAVEW